MKTYRHRLAARNRFRGRKSPARAVSFPRAPLFGLEELELRALLSGASALQGAWQDTAPATVDPFVGSTLAIFRLEAQNMSDTTITSIVAGQDFQLAAFVQDVRDPPLEPINGNVVAGLWAAFMNVSYDAGLASITPTAHASGADPGFEFGTFFSGGLKAGEVGTPGQIVGAGSSSLNFSGGSGTDQVLLWRITVHANASGALTFTPSFYSDPFNESLLFEPEDPLTAEQIQFNPVTLEIIASTSISITPAVSHDEGNTGTTPSTPYVFTVSLSESSAQQITVAYATSAGSAQADDFVAQSATLTFAPGETSKDVTIDVVGDTTVELDETFNVTLSSPTNATLGATTTGVGTIVNDDFPSISITPTASHDEGNTGTSPSTPFAFTVSLSESFTQQVAVVYATSAGSAQTDDFIAQSATLTFAPGETSKDITIDVVGDTEVELDETFNVTLSSPTNATLGLTTTGVGTIVNDDRPVIAVANVSQLEGAADGNMVFSVTISQASPTAVVVPFQTVDIGATSSGLTADYASASGSVTFAAGSVESQLVTVVIHGDATNEDNEDFSLVLTQPANAVFDGSNGQALGTILNDDGPFISFEQQSVSHAEGDSETTAFVFTVNLSVPTDIPITVQYSTADGTATQPGDYGSTSGTLTFLGEGALSQNVTVLVQGDTLAEANETFLFNLSNAVGATLSQSSATGTIENDDPLPSLSFAESPVSITEGNSGSSALVFTVNLSAASGLAVTVQYGTNNGTATTADGDYAAASGTLTFAPGDTQKLITVTVNGDSKDEPDESFTLDLFNSVGASNADSALTKITATGTVLDDDAAPTLNIIDVLHTEADNTQRFYIFTMTLSAASGHTIVVPYATSDGTATIAANDYDATSGTITFSPGETVKAITALSNGDFLNEADETFHINLTPSDNVVLSRTSALATIQNDDPEPELIVTGGGAKNEGNSGTTDFVFTVSLNTPSGQTVTVDFSTTDGTATVTNNDYVGQSGQLTFAPLQTSQLVTVAVNGDTRNETDETFNLVLSNPINARLGSGTIGNPFGQGLVLNDDSLPSLSINDVSQAEGNSGNTAFVFQVSLSALSGQSVTVAYATANGTATIANNDYLATSGTLTFVPGVGTQNVTVQVVGDLFDESDETFVINLTSPSNATLGDAQGTGTIQDELTDNVTFTLSTISGKLWIDVNNSNSIDAGELSLTGQVATLTGTSSISNTAVNKTSTTDASGNYSFADLEPGNYTVKIQQPSGYTPVEFFAGSSLAVQLPGNPLGYTVSVPALGGITAANNNFAVLGLLPEKISQRFFLASYHGAAANSASVAAAPQAASLLASAAASSEAMIAQNGGTVTVDGTAGDDVIEFTAGSTHTLKVNGVLRQFSGASVTRFVFDGGGGQDTVALTGTSGNEEAELGVGSGTLSGANFSVFVGQVSDLTIAGNGGHDVARLHDSALSDHLQAAGSELSLANELDETTRLLAFAQVQASSTLGGTDTAEVGTIDFALEQQGDWLAL